MINEIYEKKINDPLWVKGAIETILGQGYVVLEHFLTDAAFKELLHSAQGVGNKKTGVLKDSVAYRLAHSSEIMNFFQAIYKERCVQEGVPYEPLKESQQRVGFPYKDARDGKRTEETDYHFDGAYVNTTLALIMPPKGGELIAFPNLRTKRHSVSALILSHMMRYLPAFRRIMPHVVVRSKPNDLCLFFGDRMFHGVEPIGEGERLILTINNHW